ncbi:neprilysin-1 [Dermacentor silvarum]|uniref:neprilysin-1 n=1 Tax=Dermacentor silvarum TaxID=543639 RepID=UPI00189BE353|nr:neprilysin-1 [Dermacentor silvarum]
MNLSAKPCDNFYLYVCGQRDPRLSVRRIVLEDFIVTFVTSAVAAGTGDANQTVGRKAKDFLKTCHDVIATSVDNVLWVKEMMAAAKLSWPYLGRENDAIHSLVHMAVCCAWPSFLEFTQANESGGILMEPSPYRDAHLQRRRRDLDNDALGDVYEKYYGILLQHYASGSGGSVDLREMIRLEEPFNILTTGEGWPEESATTYKWRDSRAWKRVLTKLAETFHTTNNVQVMTAHTAYLDRLLELSFQNESQVVLVLGWHVVQYMAPFSNRDLAINHYTGRKDAATPIHYNYCLFLTNSVTGIGCIADFVRENFTDNVEADVGQLATAVRRILLGNDSLAYPYKKLDTVLKYFEKARSRELDMAYEKVPPMGANFAENLARTTVALRPSFETVVRGIPSRAYLSESFYTYDGRDYSLFPDAIVFPMYLEDAPEPIRYGMLGAELARGAAQAYFDIIPRKHIRGLLQCMQRATKVHSHREVSTQALVDLASIDAAFKAFVDSGLDASAELAVAPGMTGRQLFYVSFCYSMCSTLKPTDFGRCNDVLRNTSNFADAFSCPEGSYMRPSNQCTIAF